MVEAERVTTSRPTAASGRSGEPAMLDRTIRLETQTELPGERVIASCVQVYRESFAEPPYGETPMQADQLRDRLGRYSERGGFRLVVAWRNDDRVVGFGLSAIAHPGDWWRERVAATIGPDLARTWLGTAVTEVVHLAVAPDSRRSGLASAVLSAMTTHPDGLGAVLSCHPDATAARRLYLSRGWQTLSVDFRTQPGQLGYWLMVKPPTNSSSPRSPGIRSAGLPRAVAPTGSFERVAGGGPVIATE
jgi:ribosomal protein S18 acetylase RimI-like enzyme